MRIYVNGKETEAAEKLTVEALISGKGLDPGTVVVEYNLQILPKEDWAGTVLSAEDKLELISFVGGG